jgi:hypothetical protein
MNRVIISSFEPYVRDSGRYEFCSLRVAQNHTQRLSTFDFSLSQTSVDMTSGGLNAGTEYGHRGVALGHAQDVGDGGNWGYKWVNGLAYL